MRSLGVVSLQTRGSLFCTLHFYTLASSDIVCVLTGGGGGVQGRGRGISLCGVLCTLNPRCFVLVDISASFFYLDVVFVSYLTDCGDGVRSLIDG